MVTNVFIIWYIKSLREIPVLSINMKTEQRWQRWIASYHIAVRWCQLTLTAGPHGNKHWRDCSARHGPLYDKSAFSGLTSNMDALTRWLYALWNKGPYSMSIVPTYYSLCLLPSLNLLADGFITLLCCNRAPVFNLCSLSVILHSQTYEHSASQWAVELVWLPITIFHHNSDRKSVV